MATEIARIDVLPGSEVAFEAAAARAVTLFRDAAGCRAMHVQRSHEHLGRYWLFVVWDDVAAHEAFRNTASFGEWRSLVGAFFAAPPLVEHGLDICISTSG